MKHTNTKKLNNKGFTLVELLVVMAIMGVISILIISLVGNGLKMYTGETGKADVQNDIQMVNTKIQKTLMEATTLTIKNESSGGKNILYVLTGDWKTETDMYGNDISGWDTATNPNNTARAIIAYDKTVYIADKYYSPADVAAGNVSKGYAISTNITSDTFKASLKNEVTGGSTKMIEGPVVVHVEYKMDKNKSTSRSSYDVTLRNSSNIAGVTSGSDFLTME